MRITHVCVVINFMSELDPITPPAQDIPEACVGCPMLELAASLYVSNVRDNEAFIQQRASEASERDQENLADFFDLAAGVTHRTAEETYQKTMEDLGRIAAVTALMPDSEDMTVPEFLRIYRTDENKLGDESFIDVLPVSRAVEVSANTVATIKENAERNLLHSPEFIEKEVTLIGTGQRYRKALEGKSETIYTDSVNRLVGNCPLGLIVKTVGIRKKKTASFCGSQAFKGTNN